MGFGLPCRETIGREECQESEESTPLHEDPRLRPHDFAITLLSVEWQPWKLPPAHSWLMQYCHCPFSCIGTLRSPSLWRGLRHIETSTFLKLGRPYSTTDLGLSRLMLVFLIKQCPSQSSKGPVGVTSYATTPGHRGFRMAGILGVAPGNMEDLWNDRPGVVRLRSQFQGYLCKAKVMIKGRTHYCIHSQVWNPCS